MTREIQLILKSIIFWDMTPCSPLSLNRRFEGTSPPTCLLVFTELISSTLKKKAICSSETSVETQRITRRYIPEDDTLHNHLCEKPQLLQLIQYFSLPSKHHLHKQTSDLLL
jgi:hypothetical protein